MSDFKSEQYPFFEEFSKQVMFEFDLKREAEFQKKIAKSIAEEFPDIVIPKVTFSLIIYLTSTAS
jgi:predicted unusual protein kinase regulating ubiquinone biosynthesis (AarF/ABC1/UbiB family)